MEGEEDTTAVSDATPVQETGLSPHKAKLFADRWKDATNEKQDAQSFWREFFIDVVGLTDLREAGIEFEKKVISSKKGTTNYIDVYWKDNLLIEHKSAGKDLDAAEDQARDYLLSLPPAQRPPVIIISDFARFRVVEYLVNKHFEFPLTDLPQELHRIEAIVSGHTQGVAKEEVEADQKAAKLMADLYTELEKNGYEGHEASVFLVRILFCLFADDTRMWKTGLFSTFLKDTSEDGKDIGSRIQSLFETLDTSKEQRPRVMDDLLVEFPYVNGGLFSEKLPIFFFTPAMRKALLNASAYDWSGINPTIFGSLFQAIKSKEERRAGGEHYTTEKSINAALDPLLMDELNRKLENAWDNDTRLRALQQELGEYQILDPACGSGNFLITAYKRLRQLELEIIQRIKQLQGTTSQVGLLDATMELSVGLSQLHGIEYEEWSSQIATVAIFLTDHQQNLTLETVLGYAPDRFPLSKSANIIHGNSLRIDWATVCPMTDKTVIVGNPPFKGSNRQSDEQREDTAHLWQGKKGSGSLDYVANWYLLAAKHIQHKNARAAFVSTNSITQGEQPQILWSSLYELGMDIDFAHRTFAWESDASGKASVHCVIIGFSARPKPKKLKLWTYRTPTSPAELTEASVINAYLLDAPKVLISPRSKPLQTQTQPMRYGNMPNEFGYLANIYEEDLEPLRATDDVALKYIRPLIGASEMLKGDKRYCLWLVRAEPSDMEKSAFIRERIAMVKQLRLESKRAATVKLAQTPYLFQEVREQTTPYLAVPIVSSENREYIPMALKDPDVIPTNRLLTIPNSDYSTFAVLQSKVFSAWSKAVSGRLKNDFSISAEITYNNFPFPELTSDSRSFIAETGKAIEEARNSFPNSSLASLYKEDLMPVALRKAHDLNDKAVLAAYGMKKSSNETEILTFLFAKYAELTSQGQLIPPTK